MKRMVLLLVSAFVLVASDKLYAGDGYIDVDASGYTSTGRHNPSGGKSFLKASKFLPKVLDEVAYPRCDIVFEGDACAVNRCESLVEKDDPYGDPDFSSDLASAMGDTCEETYPGALDSADYCDCLDAVAEARRREYLIEPRLDGIQLSCEALYDDNMCAVENCECSRDAENFAEQLLCVQGYSRCVTDQLVDSISRDWERRHRIKNKD